MKRSGAVWLCLHFPQLALEVFDDRDASHPAAAIERRVVHCANRDNLEAGLALTTAYALYPDLLVLERQPQREADLLQNLAALAYGFTPAVSLAADNSLLLEIGSCRRLYRGILPLLERLQSALLQRRHQVLSGFAQTPKAAWLLARYPQVPALNRDDLDLAELQSQLDAMPVALLQIDAASIKSLLHMGVETLGQLRALPAAALSKRFGQALVDYLQKLWGDTIDPQLLFSPAPVFRQGFAFVDGIPQRQMLLFPMKRLLQILCDYLRVRQLHCHVLRWQLFDAHQLQAEIIIELSRTGMSRTQNEWPDFLELTRLKLDQVTLRESVFSLNLLSEDFFATAPASTQLFPDAKDHAEAGHALIDRLTARLGKEALQRVEVCDAHWPEHSWRSAGYRSISHREAAPTMPMEFPALPAPRPLWLLPEPKPLRLRDGQPFLQSVLTLLRGPERLGSHWWCETAAGGRDYYVARTRDGRLGWIYCEPESLQWFLHGWFA